MAEWDCSHGFFLEPLSYSHHSVSLWNLKDDLRTGETGYTHFKSVADVNGWMRQSEMSTHTHYISSTSLYSVVSCTQDRCRKFHCWPCHVDAWTADLDEINHSTRLWIPHAGVSSLSLHAHSQLLTLAYCECARDWKQGFGLASFPGTVQGPGNEAGLGSSSYNH